MSIKLRISQWVSASAATVSLIGNECAWLSGTPIVELSLLLSVPFAWHKTHFSLRCFIFFISFFFYALSLKRFAKTFLITDTAYHNTLQITIISVSYNSSKFSWPLFCWYDFHCVINAMQVMLMPCSLFIFRIAKFAILFAFPFSTQIESGKKWFITLFWGWCLRKWVCFYKS